MASSPITSPQRDGGKMETVTDFISGGSKITIDGDSAKKLKDPCSLEAQTVESACSAADPGSNPQLGKSPGKGNGNPLQHSCLDISMHRGPWQATVHKTAESDMTEQLNNNN